MELLVFLPNEATAVHVCNGGQAIVAPLFGCTWRYFQAPGAELPQAVNIELSGVPAHAWDVFRLQAWCSQPAASGHRRRRWRRRRDSPGGDSGPGPGGSTETGVPRAPVHSRLEPRCHAADGFRCPTLRFSQQSRRHRCHWFAWVARPELTRTLRPRRRQTHPTASGVIATPSPNVSEVAVLVHEATPSPGLAGCATPRVLTRHLRLPIPQHRSPARRHCLPRTPRAPMTMLTLLLRWSLCPGVNLCASIPGDVAGYTGYFLSRYSVRPPLC